MKRENFVSLTFFCFNTPCLYSSLFYNIYKYLKIKKNSNDNNNNNHIHTHVCTRAIIEETCNTYYTFIIKFIVVVMMLLLLCIN